MPVITARIASLAALLLATAAHAGGVPPPRDVAYPGTLRLAVDATDIEHRLFRVHESLPVAPGPLTLLYPKWLPGNHAPTGPIEALAGLVISGGDRPIEWQRDPLDMYAFHVAVPRGITRLEISFEFASATDSAQGRRVMTPDLLGLQWEKTLLYPAGHYARRISVAPEVTLPAGWTHASALQAIASAGNVVSFAPVTLEQLVDSPLFAGRYAQRLPLATRRSRARVPQRLRRPAPLLQISPAQLTAHRQLLRETPGSIRAAALRPLRLPARDQRQLQRHRPRAPAVE